MIVRLAAEAERDLEAIGGRIARDDWARAVSFVRNLRDSCLGLVSFPERFPLVPRFEAHGVRHRVHGNYLISHQVKGEEVMVIHILHGAMDYASILFPDEA